MGQLLNLVWPTLVLNYIMKLGFVVFPILLAHVSLAKFGGKQLGLFNVVQFPNDPCIGNSGRNGTCYLKDECEARDGDARGECAEGYGVCCIMSLACGTTGSDNLTYLVQNPTTTPGDSCSYTICPSSKAICRLRFDFLKFEIAGPFSEDMTNTNEGTVGDCVDD